MESNQGKVIACFISPYCRLIGQTVRFTLIQPVLDAEGQYILKAQACGCEFQDDCFQHHHHCLYAEGEDQQDPLLPPITFPLPLDSIGLCDFKTLETS